MSFELWNSIAATGTFLVIAVTAIAALVQLRHMQRNNRIIAMDDLRRMMTEPDFAQAQNFVLTELPAMLADPAFRYQLAHRGARTSEVQTVVAKVVAVGNFYTHFGVLERTGILDADLVSSLWGANVLGIWERVAPVVSILRRTQPDVWENFEYAVVKAQDFLQAHPSGTYPRGVRRVALRDDWLEADREYAASRTAGRPSIPVDGSFTTSFSPPSPRHRDPREKTAGPER